MIDNEHKMVLISLVVSCLLVAALHVLGITPRLDRAISDQFFRLGDHSAPQSKVVLVTLPAPLDQRTLDLLRHAAPDASAWVLADQWDVARPPVSLVYDDRTPAACLPRPADGIFRRYQADCFDLVSGSMAEFSAAQATGLIDFAIGRGHLPQLTLAQALNDRWLAELSQERVVFLAQSDRRQVTLLTPLDRPGDAGMNWAEFQALALDSLLAGRTIQAPGVIPVLGFIVLTTLVFWLAMQWVPLTVGRLVVAQLLLWPLLGFIVQRHVGWALPIVALLLAGLAAVIVATLARRRTERRQLDRIDQHLNGIVSHRLIRQPLDQAADPWPEVQQFLMLHLNLSRSILLELPSGGHHVREVVSHGCSIKDIHERRRDIRRAPYTEAVANRGPTQPSRPFLKDALAGGVDYLTPLRFGADLIGVWYASFDPELPEVQRPTEHDLQVFAGHTAQLLAQWRAGQQARPGRWTRWLPQRFGRRYRQLEQAGSVIDQRLVTLERILNGLKRPTFAFDLFGRLQLSNKAGELLARDEQLALYETDALTLLINWCGLEKADARDVLRDVILSRQRYDLPAEGLGQLQPYLLHVRGIEVGETDNDAGELLGVVMELIDIQRLHQSHRWFRELTDQFSQKVRNDLEAVSLAWQRLRSDVAADNRAASVIDRRIESAASSLETIQQHVENEMTWDASHVSPVDVRGCLDSAQAAARNILERHQLSIDRSVPAFVSLAFARQQELTDWLRAALHLLASDAVAGSALAVSIGESTNERAITIAIDLSNQGYGMPDDHVQRVMASGTAQAGEADALAQLAEHSFNVRRWGADVTVVAEIGKGYQVGIRLRGLNLG